MMGPNTMAGTSGPAMCTAMAGHINGRLAYLKAELKITEAQEQPWNTHAAAARDNTKAMLATIKRKLQISFSGDPWG